MARWINLLTGTAAARGYVSLCQERLGQMKELNYKNSLVDIFIEIFHMNMYVSCLKILIGVPDCFYSQNPARTRISSFTGWILAV